MIDCEVIEYVYFKTRLVTGLNIQDKVSRCDNNHIVFMRYVDGYRQIFTVETGL